MSRELIIELAFGFRVVVSYSYDYTPAIGDGWDEEFVAESFDISIDSIYQLDSHDEATGFQLDIREMDEEALKEACEEDLIGSETAAETRKIEDSIDEQ